MGDGLSVPFIVSWFHIKITIKSLCKITYRKIPKISPGVYIFQYFFYFFEGLIFGGLIYGGKFAF